MMNVPISNLPIIAVFLLVAVVGVIVIVFALAKTKPATDEARLGKYEITVFPSGKRYSGLLSLARNVVSEEWLVDLTVSETITDEQAETLKECFDELFFGGLRSGSSKYLVISPINLEDEEYARTIKEVFEFPFGWVAKRVVVAEGVETQRAGWKVLVINPMNLRTREKPETFRNMLDIGEAAASVKEAAIRVKKGMPWKEIAKAREKQLKQCQDLWGESQGTIAELRLSAAKPSLLEPTHEEGIPSVPVRPSKGLPWGRIITTLVAFLLAFMYIVPNYAPPRTDPFLPAIVVCFVSFGAYPTVKKILQRWFF